MPTLVLLRHAKAEPHRLDDATRELADRGRADALAVRRWLDDRGIVPDRVVVSPATRTRQTWELAGTVEPVVDARVYEAEVEDLREVVGETPGDVRVLVLVGHNPGVERLAWELDDSVPGMATSGVAVFDVASWQLDGAVLREQATPRG